MASSYPHICDWADQDFANRHQWEFMSNASVYQEASQAPYGHAVESISNWVQGESSRNQGSPRRGNSSTSSNFVQTRKVNFDFLRQQKGVWVNDLMV